MSPNEYLKPRFPDKRRVPAFGFLCKAKPLLLQIGGSPLMGRAADQRHRKSRFNMPYPTLTAFNLFKCMSLESEVQVLCKRDLGQRNTGRIWHVWSIAAKAASAYHA